MKAVIVSQPGPPESLVVVERPTPAPSANEVLIEVRAAGLNRADVLQRQGHYPPPPGVSLDVPGLEVAGVVTACGPAARRWKAGDAVCALLAGGGYAAAVAVDADHCLPVPTGWSFTDAAALPEAACTVWSNVMQRGRLQSGERFLVHGGSSGIGLMAIQLAAARGAHVFATAGTDEKCRACTAAGAGRAINYRTEDFEAVLKDEGIDVILDMVGGEYAAKNLRLLRSEGRLVSIAAMRGTEAVINILQMMARRLTLTGSTLRGRDRAFKAALVAEVEREVWPLAAAGRLRANVSQVFPLDQAADAHRLMESSRHIGKIVLSFD
jgi:putative PIG3 family NAD(P)H quinone oxidoreductase